MGPRGPEGPPGARGSEGFDGADGARGPKGADRPDGRDRPGRDRGGRRHRCDRRRRGDGPRGADCVAQRHHPVRGGRLSAATVIDLSSDPLAVPFAGRVMATATVQLRNPSAEPREARCKLQIVNALDPQATPSDISLTYATDLPAEAGYDETVTVSGGASKPTGTYNVSLVCFESGSGSRFLPSARTCRSGPPTSALTSEEGARGAPLHAQCVRLRLARDDVRAGARDLDRDDLRVGGRPFARRRAAGQHRRARAR